MTIGERENVLRTIEMRDPKWIPSFVNIQGEKTWRKYGKDLEDLILQHPSIKGESGYNEVDLLQVRRNLKAPLLEECAPHEHRGPLIDEWGCEWHSIMEGIGGLVKKHPLEDWSALDSYRPPPNNAAFNATPPKRRIHSLLAGLRFNGNWDQLRKGVEEARSKGLLTWGTVGHGFLFQRLYYLRGFNNLMKDIITKTPELKRLIDTVAERVTQIVNNWLEIGVNIIYFGDDLGTQSALTIPPNAFRQFIFPVYSKIFGAVRASGTHVYFHTDGHVLEIANDLVRSGVSVLNIRIFQNQGIEAVRKAFKGKLCLDVGTDKQFVIPWGSPGQVEDYVKELVLKLGSKEGGLILIINLGGADMADVPLANIEALFKVIEKFRLYYWK